MTEVRILWVGEDVHAIPSLQAALRNCHYFYELSIINDYQAAEKKLAQYNSMHGQARPDIIILSAYKMREEVFALIQRLKSHERLGSVPLLFLHDRLPKDTLSEIYNLGVNITVSLWESTRVLEVKFQLALYFWCQMQVYPAPLERQPLL